MSEKESKIVRFIGMTDDGQFVRGTYTSSKPEGKENLAERMNKTGHIGFCDAMCLLSDSGIWKLIEECERLEMTKTWGDTALREALAYVLGRPVTNPKDDLIQKSNI